MSLCRIAPDAAAAYLDYARRRNAGLCVVEIPPRSTPSRDRHGIKHPSSLQAPPQQDRLQPTSYVPGPNWFTLTYFAVVPTASRRYADDLGIGGFQTCRQLAAVTHDHVVPHGIPAAAARSGVNSAR